MKTRYPTRVLAVDDEMTARDALATALGRFGHDVEVARDALEAQGKLRLDVSLLVLDAEMPGMDGFELAQRVRADPEWADIPILMVTGRDSQQDRLRAVEAGVSDFLPKPWELVELHLRSEALLRVKSSLDGVKRERADLEAEVSRRTGDLRRTLEDLAAAHRHTYQAHLDTVRSLVHAAECKDVDTAAHIDRIRWYADLLARGMGLSPHEIELIREATPMHDVGKIGIPDAVLLKPGPLTPAERLVMQRHTEIGARILGESDAEVLRLGRIIALSHHERWDGRGYPHRLAGKDIPLPARICAVADVFDALTMDRCYRLALPNEEVRSLMKAGRGSQFDPGVLDVFLGQFPEVERIQAAHRDRSLEARTA
ncbi:MAG TPA: HD domain-containing phosphohydrolase [Longimicrobiales bacterium]|nr:HD domain-containing phosphohydrolase [Longimicrobiales bacterium]